MTIYKSRTGGTWEYWIDDRDNGGRVYLTERGVARLLRQGYRLVELVY
jgi:hypothetical protein